MDILLGLSIGITLFLISIKAYILGLKHGKTIAEGNIPKMNLNPLKPILEAVKDIKTEKEAEKITDGLEDFMSYTRESALKAVESGVK